ncbi:hypothetical protein Bbelb_401440 [Branchiostoma belcheri]|nr:hypothetical protein Bbelb_401440 [Branchiostoma belcheri]
MAVPVMRAALPKARPAVLTSCHPCPSDVCSYPHSQACCTHLLPSLSQSCAQLSPQPGLLYSPPAIPVPVMCAALPTARPAVLTSCHTCPSDVCSCPNSQACCTHLLPSLSQSCVQPSPQPGLLYSPPAIPVPVMCAAVPTARPAVLTSCHPCPSHVCSCPHSQACCTHLLPSLSQSCVQLSPQPGLLYSPPAIPVPVMCAALPTARPAVLTSCHPCPSHVCSPPHSQACCTHLLPSLSQSCAQLSPQPGLLYSPPAIPVPVMCAAVPTARLAVLTSCHPCPSDVYSPPHSQACCTHLLPSLSQSCAQLSPQPGLLYSPPAIPVPVMCAAVPTARLAVLTSCHPCPSHVCSCPHSQACCTHLLPSLSQSCVQLSPQPGLLYSPPAIPVPVMCTALPTARLAVLLLPERQRLLYRQTHLLQEQGVLELNIGT